MRASPVLEAFRQLTVDEKIRVLHETWDEVAADAANLPVTAEERERIDARLADHEAHPEAASAWEGVRDEILRKLRCID